MNTYNSTIGTPTPTPFYDQAIAPMHWDGVFFALLCFGSWVLFIFVWAWNHKPRKRAKLSPRPSKWEMPSNHWRN